MKNSSKRGVMGRMGLVVSAGLLALTVTACGHQPMAGAMESMGMGGGKDGAGMMGGHHGRSMSDADQAKHRTRMMERATKELQLDDAQQKRLGVLLDKMQARRQAMMASAGGKSPHAQMQEKAQAVIAGDKFDRAAAQALVDARSQSMKADSGEIITAAGDFFDSLKPEQQVKVRDFLKRSGPGGMHHGRGMRD